MEEEFRDKLSSGERRRIPFNGVPFFVCIIFGPNCWKKGNRRSAQVPIFMDINAHFRSMLATNDHCLPEKYSAPQVRPFSTQEIT